jgi:ADP-ribose pyrophosphatase YjhB (NUDIX family)
MDLRRGARGLAYGVFYRLPGRWRRRLVRLGMPTYTIGAVVVLRDERDRLLLIRQPPGHGWSVPAGLMDRGEQPVVAAARELGEEAGIKISPEELTALQPNALVHLDGRWIDFVFTGRVPGDTPLTVDGGEVLEAQWFRLDALPPLTVPTARLLANYGIGPYVDYPEARV